MRYALGVVILLLLALIAAEWFLLPGAPDISGSIPIDRETVQPKATRAVSEFRLPALRVYREIEQRPLFSRHRGADTPPPRPQPQVPILYPTQLVLQAILITPETHSVLLYDRERHETLNVHLQEQIQGWTVTEIEENHVTLTKDGYRIPLRLR